MKKSLLLAIMALFSFGVANAQMPTPEEVQASVTRYHKLQALKKPDAVGMSKIDALASKADQSAKNSVEISMLLERVAGISPEANADQPLSLEEAIVLSTRIDQENKDLKDLTDMVPGAAEEMKSAKPLAIPKATKSLNYSKEVVSIATAETAYHTKTIAGIMAALKK